MHKRGKKIDPKSWYARPVNPIDALREAVKNGSVWIPPNATYLRRKGLGILCIMVGKRAHLWENDLYGELPAVIVDDANLNIKLSDL